MKKILLLFTFTIIFFLNSGDVFAVCSAANVCQHYDACRKGVDDCAKDSDGHVYTCKTEESSGIDKCLPSAVQDIFGKIEPPDALKGFVKNDPTGAGGLSLFLSNLVALIYSIAGIVLIFMILWGAFDWMSAEGDKEKLERARNKIMNAIIGILLFGAAFGIIKVLGQFTGFKFFVGQDDVQNIPTSVTAPSNVTSPTGLTPRSVPPRTTTIIPAACTNDPCACVTIRSLCSKDLEDCKPDDPGHNNVGCVAKNQ